MRLCMNAAVTDIVANILDFLPEPVVLDDLQRDRKQYVVFLEQVLGQRRAKILCYGIEPDPELFAFRGLKGPHQSAKVVNRYLYI